MPESQHRNVSELPITINRGSEQSLPTQIAAELRAAIDRGVLRPNEPLPSSRQLARSINVARGVVVTAYAQLITEGYLTAAKGRGTRVHPGLQAAPHEKVTDMRGTDTLGTVQSAPPPQPPLAPGLPHADALDTAAWRAVWRRASTTAATEVPALGDPRLRTAIAEHLRQMRGTQRPASDVLITAGARDGLSLLLHALGTNHRRSLTIGVEDPGYPSLRRVAARYGANIIALPVDDEGLMTAGLPLGLLDAVIVTPSHQYPLGGSLPLSRRQELLAWARQGGAIIIEDDYDSELRHSGSPLPALAALDDSAQGHVALLGTFSKTLSPALAAGYLLTPTNLSQILAPVRSDLGGSVSAIVQSALAEFLSSGEFRKHTARMRRHYAARRELLVERLFGIPGVEVRAMSGGLHAVLEFTVEREASERAAIAVCNSAGLGAMPLSSYWHGSSAVGSPASGRMQRFGVVIGTGGSHSDAEFATALATLREALGSLVQERSRK